MCTRFVYNGNDTIVGFNFEIDLSVWTHKVIEEANRFVIGILMEDGNYHSFHGVHRNGNVGTLLYVHENENGRDPAKEGCVIISELTECFVKGEITLDDALKTVQKKRVLYAPDTSMQAMLSDKSGRVLIIEPGIGYRFERTKFSLLTNGSVLQPETTKAFLTDGDNRFEQAREALEKYGEEFTVEDAFRVLKQVSQEGIWGTRVSFVYSVRENCVYWVTDNQFEEVSAHTWNGGSAVTDGS